MKLRIKGNSIRLRLLRSEIAALGETGRISESTVFGIGPKETLTYTIQVSENTDKVSAGFCENEICIVIPGKLAEEWISTELVALSGTLDLADQALEILVEKDFVCLTRIDDPDNNDAFPNPEAKDC